jgi:hypothetical protein
LSGLMLLFCSAQPHRPIVARFSLRITPNDWPPTDPRHTTSKTVHHRIDMNCLS